MLVLLLKVVQHVCVAACVVAFVTAFVLGIQQGFASVIWTAGALLRHGKYFCTMRAFVRSDGIFGYGRV